MPLSQSVKPTNNRFFSQNFSSLALTVCYLWYYKDLEEKADWLTDLMNCEAVYRTAPATPGSVKKAYDKFISFGILGSFVACLRAKVLNCPWNAIFPGFSAEDELRLKLIASSPQIPMWYEKWVMMWNSNCCKVFFSSLWYDDIPNCVVDTVWNITIAWEKLFKKKCYPHHHTFNFFTNQEAQLWPLLVLWYVLLHHLFKHKNDRTSPTYIAVHFNWNI